MKNARSTNVTGAMGHSQAKKERKKKNPDLKLTLDTKTNSKK